VVGLYGVDAEAMSGAGGAYCCRGREVVEVVVERRRIVVFSLESAVGALFFSRHNVRCCVLGVEYCQWSVSVLRLSRWKVCSIVL
jgi:hypothetical protein